MKEPIRVYADTSVFGGVFDDRFAEASRTFFQRVQGGVYDLVISSIAADEVELAPTRVRELFERIRPFTRMTEITERALDQRTAYLKAGIVSSHQSTDALHVALATVSGCQVIASWNFRHVVHYEKIDKYNAVNRLHEYQEIAIHSPWEII